MRDRNFITWLIGLIAMPVLLFAFPSYANDFVTAVPLVLSIAAVLALLVTSIATWIERERERNNQEEKILGLVQIRRSIAHHR
jgi:hypothetical protein